VVSLREKFKKPHEIRYLQPRYIIPCTVSSLMRDIDNPKGKGKKSESARDTPVPGAGSGAVGTKPAPLTAKEKIAANQRNKRRK